MSTVSALGVNGFLNPKEFKEIMNGKAAEEALTADAIENLKTLTDSNGRVSANALLSKHMLSPGDDNQSKYMKARQAGQEALRVQANRQNNILNSAMTQVVGDSYADRILAGKRIARRMMEEKQQSVTEAFERTLSENKKTMEEKIQGATEGMPGGVSQTSEAAISEAPAPEAAAPSAASVDIVV